MNTTPATLPAQTPESTAAAVAPEAGSTQEATVATKTKAKKSPKKTKAKTKAKKAAGAPRIRQPKSDLFPKTFTADGYKIHVKDEFREKNPKRAGTAGEKMFAALVRYHGKTVKEFVENNTARFAELKSRPMAEISYGLKKKYIELKKI